MENAAGAMHHRHISDGFARVTPNTRGGKHTQGSGMAARMARPTSRGCCEAQWDVCREPRHVVRFDHIVSHRPEDSFLKKNTTTLLLITSNISGVGGCLSMSEAKK